MADKEKKTTDSKNNRIIESTSSNNWAIDNFNNLATIFLFYLCMPLQMLFAIFGYYDTMYYWIMSLELLPADATSWVNVMNEGSQIYEKHGALNYDFVAIAQLQMDKNDI